MKVSKIFGFVLCLHLAVIAVLIVQPGCSTTQPPTQSYEQRDTIQSPSGTTRALSSPNDLIPAVRADGLDPAFNADMDDEGLYEPRRPRDDFGIDPLDPRDGADSEGMSVDVAGESFETHTVEKGDSLWKISKRYGVSLDELYAANDMNKNSVLRVGQQIRIPVEGGTASVRSGDADAYQPTGYTGSTETYTVRAGDTLSRIANRFDTTVRAIQAANDKSSDMIRVGEELTIPVSGERSRGGDEDASSSPDRSSGDHRTHTVKSGEYPATIARRYGMTTNELLALNGITDPRSLQVGQKLKVSGSGSAENVDSRTETVVSPEPAPAATDRPDRSAPRPAPSDEPLEIRVVEADPLVEGEAAEMNADAGDDGDDGDGEDGDDAEADAMFEDAVEIPVIRMEDE
ncbi:MAG: LysM peptidoglycan-binding domain-containing protein [Opitutales bacterium]